LSRSTMSAAGIAVALGLVAPAAALAAAPTLNSAAATPDRHLTATWTLPPGAENRQLVASHSNVPSEHFGLEGGGYAWFSHGFASDDYPQDATSFTSPRPLDPGTWYVRVGAYDPSDPPDTRWSNILSFTIAAKCANGVDDDGDGKVDQAGDPGCLSVTDDDETDPPPPPQPGAPGAATVIMRRIDGLGAVRASGVRAGIVCPRACRATARLLLAERAAKRLGLSSAAVVVGRGSSQLSQAGYGILTARLTTRAKRKLKAARSVKLKLETVLVGADGNGLGTFTRTVRLVRPNPANQAPAFPAPMSFTRETTYRYDEQGRLMGGFTAINVTTPPTDANGDPLMYTWTASRGDIRFIGLSVVWTRTMDFGQFAAGALTLTVSDGRGGSDSFTFNFQRGAG
jgi:hypothetical protein